MFQMKKFFNKNYIKKYTIFEWGYWNDFYVINAPSWSISIEFWVSLLIPLVFNRLRLTIKCIIVTFWLPLFMLSFRWVLLNLFKLQRYLCYWDQFVLILPKNKEFLIF